MKMFYDLYVNFRKFRGELILSHGKHRIYIVTKFTPNKVWISPATPTHATCNPIEDDEFSVTVVDKGFILSADIKSEKRKIEWMIK